jgi:hypothetical protein
MEPTNKRQPPREKSTETSEMTALEVVSRRLTRSLLRTGLSEDQVRQQISDLIEGILGSISWALDDERNGLNRGAVALGTEEALSSHPPKMTG